MRLNTMSRQREKLPAEREAGETFDKGKLDDVATLIQRYERVSEMAYILAVPPAAPAESAKPTGKE